MVTEPVGKSEAEIGAGGLFGHALKSQLQLFSAVEYFTKYAFCEKGQVCPTKVNGLKHIFQKTSNLNSKFSIEIHWLYHGLK